MSANGQTSKALRIMLSGGDRRSIGQASQVAAAVVRDPAQLDPLWACLADADAVIRMRAADALEKISRDNPFGLEKYRSALLAFESDDGSKEVRWHLVTMASRPPLSSAEASSLFDRLETIVDLDPSRIVKVSALQAAYDVQLRHRELLSRFQRMCDFAMVSPWPSLRARSRARARRISDTKK